MSDGNTHAIAQHLADQEEWDELQEVSVQEAAKVLLDHLPNPIFDLLKPHMLSEFSQAFPYTDENGDEVFSQVNISWVTQKQIIRHALRTLYAELTGGKDER